MILIKVKIAEQRPPDVARDAWRAISRTAHTEQGAHWHKEMLPDHFNERAKFRYHHQARTSKYKKQKKRDAERGKALFGGMVDNVRSGNLMRSLQSLATIRGFPSRVTVTMYGPRYIAMRPNRYAGSNQPDKAKEILTVTQEQQKELGNVLGESITRQLNAYRAPRTTNIG